MRRLAAAIVGLLMFPVLSFAGKDYATISGTVQDSAGRLMSGALVSITAQTSGLDRMAFTDLRGAFVFENALHVYGGNLDGCRVFTPDADGRFRQSMRTLSYHD